MKQIETPTLLVDYKGVIRVEFLYDDKVIRTVQAPGRVAVPECPVKPLIKLTCLRANGEASGDVLMYDYNLEKWKPFESNVGVPKSTLVDAGTKSKKPVRKFPVESNFKSAPDLDVPPEEKEGVDDVTAD